MNSLSFEKIEIDRVLGIRRGEGFKLENLGVGVNLVHGPNGSGKTTTARAIQELLWPGQTGLERPTLSADLVSEEGRWRVDLDAGHLSCTLNGASATLVQSSPPEMRDRYRLSLHELLAADDVDFAKKIVSESQGGFDLTEAAEALGFQGAGAAGRNESKIVQTARENVRKARQIQETLEQTAGELVGLRSQHQAALAAQRDVEILDRALEYNTAASECAQLEAQLAGLPPALERLRGNERERLDEIDQRCQGVEQALRDAHSQVQSAKREIADAHLPEKGVDAQVLRELQSLQTMARERETALEGRRREKGQVVVREQQARRRLGSVLAPECLERLQTLHIEPLDDLARRADRLRALEAVLKERRQGLEPREQAIGGMDEGRLQRGIVALNEWLASAAAAPLVKGHPSWTGLIASLLLGCLGLILGIFVHPAWGGTILVAVGLLAFEWDHRRRQAFSAPVGTDARAVHRQSYESTHLDAPARWEGPAVQELLHNLLGQMAVVAFEQERVRKGRELQVEQDRLVAEQAGLEAERKTVAAQLGTDLNLKEEWLPLFIETLGEWQKYSTELKVAETDVAQQEGDRDELLRQLGEGLAPYDYPQPINAEVSRSCLDDLEARRQKRNRAADQLSALQQRMDNEYEPELSRLTVRKKELLESMGLAPEQEGMLDPWLAQLPERTKRVGLLIGQKTLRDARFRSLAGHEDLLVLDRKILEDRRADASELAGSRDQLKEKITTIERDIEHAKYGYDLTDALTVEVNAKAALETVKAKRENAQVGAALCEWVRTTTIDRSRPLVFRRAQEYLLTFTRGALRLELDDRSVPPQFLAYAGEDTPRAVDQLSSGERVQLLIAVRLAFLEQNETVRLPLLLDEVLGNSDDARAGAIVEAVKGIADSGRQVFYFTAQHDEVRKWLAQLGNSVEHRVFDLAQCRRWVGQEIVPLPITPVPRTPVPAPEGTDYAAYGMRLDVTPLNPWLERLDKVHLWHLLDEVHTLHRLLELGISTWGQLKALLAHGGVGLIEDAEGLGKRTHPVAKALEVAFENWRMGRGKPVDRAVLQNSGCVTDKFIDRVTELCGEVNGDAQRLIDSLNAGGVERWRQKNTDSLADYLREQGYLDERQPLSPGGLRVQVLTAVAEDVKRGQISVERIDRILAVVGA